MTFQIIDDDVYYDGIMIARLVVNAGTIKGREELAELLTEDLRQELAELKSDYDDLDAKMSDLYDKIDATLSQRDAYAAILGITP
jgi:hypothetical protein